MRKIEGLVVSLFVLSFLAVSASAQIQGGGYFLGQKQEEARMDAVDAAAARAAEARTAAAAQQEIRFYIPGNAAIGMRAQYTPYFCAGIAEEAAEKSTGTDSILLEQCDALAHTYASAAAKVNEAEALASQEAGAAYYNVWMTFDGGEGWSTLGKWCVDGICWVGKEFASGYMSGYEAMAKSYMSYSPAEGFADLGQMCADGVCWLGKNFADNYMAGYQAMAEGYMNTNPAEGWADIGRFCWKGVKKVWNALFNVSAKNQDNMDIVYPATLPYK